MDPESVTTAPGNDSATAAMTIAGAAPVDFRRPAVLDAATERAIALYRAIFVNSPEAIAIVGTDGRYLEQNAAHEQLIGYSDDELRGKTPAIHLGENEFQSIVRELQATGVSQRECSSRTKSAQI